MTLILKNLEKLLEPKHSNLDAKFWVQKLILKNILKKIKNKAQYISVNITNKLLTKTL